MTTISLSHVRQLRKRLGMTQHQLAQKSGVSQSLIAKLETGRIDPTFSKGKKILDHLEELARNAEPSAADMMTKNVVMIDSNKLLSDAIDMMRKHGISQVPVIEKDKLVGIVTEEFMLDADQKKKVLIHELLHIPKNFSGALLPHRTRSRTLHTVANQLFKEYKRKLKA